MSEIIQAALESHHLIGSRRANRVVVVSEYMSGAFEKVSEREIGEFANV